MKKEFNFLRERFTSLRILTYILKRRSSPVVRVLINKVYSGINYKTVVTWRVSEDWSDF